LVFLVLVSGVLVFASTARRPGGGIDKPLRSIVRATARLTDEAARDKARSTREA
jgi:hypothetical protein